MGEGRQALDVDSEQPRERICLGVTELWELGCDVLHRAVPLAQLHSGQERARSYGSGGGGETIGAQCRCQCLRSGGDTLVCRGQLSGIPLLELGDAFAGKLGNGICTGAAGEEPKRRGGHVVVVAVHAEVTGLRQDVCAGGPSAHTSCRRPVTSAWTATTTTWPPRRFGSSPAAPVQMPLPSLPANASPSSSSGMPLSCPRQTRVSPPERRHWQRH